MRRKLWFTAVLTPLITVLVPGAVAQAEHDSPPEITFYDCQGYSTPHRITCHVRVTGDGPFTFQWSVRDVPQPELTEADVTISCIPWDEPGITVRVTDADGEQDEGWVSQTCARIREI
jgi:hypothetical protein